MGSGTDVADFGAHFGNFGALFAGLQVFLGGFGRLLGVQGIAQGSLPQCDRVHFKTILTDVSRFLAPKLKQK